MPEWLSILLGVAAVLTPVIVAAMARDRTLMTMIHNARQDISGLVAAAKTDNDKLLSDATNVVHDRINRVRDEYARRDDLDGHLARFDKQMDGHMGRIDKQLDDIRSVLKELLAGRKE